MNIFKSAVQMWRLRKEVKTMGVKGLFQSKTLWGIVVSILAQVAKQYGITIDENGVTMDVLSLVASVLAVYGRYTANKTITGLYK